MRFGRWRRGTRRRRGLARCPGSTRSRRRARTPASSLTPERAQSLAEGGEQGVQGLPAPVRPEQVVRREAGGGVLSAGVEEGGAPRVHALARPALHVAPESRLAEVAGC